MPTCPSCQIENDERAFCEQCGSYLYVPSYKRIEQKANRQRHIGGD